LILRQKSQREKADEIMASTKELQKILSEIEEAPINVGCEELRKIMQKVGAPMPTTGMDSIKDKCIKSLHTTIQTEMMIKACIYAKWSCFFAALAAIVACIGIILTMCLN
jgi:hypothetical protein